MFFEFNLVSEIFDRFQLSTSKWIWAKGLVFTPIWLGQEKTGVPQNTGLTQQTN
jgi:hypothetical protein